MSLISFLQSINFRFRLAFVSILTIIVGLFVSKAMISIGMVLIGLQFFLKPNLSDTFRTFYSSKIILLSTTLFFVYLLSGLYSENTIKFWERISIKMPLLLMALGFSALKEFPSSYLKNTLYFFVTLVFITSVISVGIYCLNYETITESYKNAKVIPNIFSISHTRFSLMIAIAIFSSLYLAKERHHILYTFEKYILLFIGCFLIAFLHLLSVRSGLLAFYCSTSAIIIVMTIKHKRYLLGTFILLIFFVVPYIAYKTVPTINNKIAYMMVDVKRFVDGKSVNHYSDGNRLLSIQLGIEIGNKNPFLGIGVGDLEKEIFSTYEKNYPDISPEVRLTPHNQYVYVYAACGWIGLILFSLSSIYPLTLKESYNNYLFLSTYIILLSSFLSEATIENQLGTAVFISFYFLTWTLNPTKVKLS